MYRKRKGQDTDKKVSLRLTANEYRPCIFGYECISLICSLMEFHRGHKPTIKDSSDVYSDEMIDTVYKQKLPLQDGYGFVTSTFWFYSISGRYAGAGNGTGIGAGDNKASAGSRNRVCFLGHQYHMMVSKRGSRRSVYRVASI